MQTRHLIWSALFALALLATGCGDGSSVTNCPAGEEGCSCYDNDTCNMAEDGTALVCQQDICTDPTCPQGSSGCACYPNGTCNDGLECGKSGGGLLCHKEGCTPGAADCSCRSDGSCNTGLSCTDGTCEAVQNRGTLGAKCNADGSCETDELVCADDNTCQLTDCTRGEQKCGCTPDGTCGTTDAGAPLFCRGGMCIKHNCVPGQPGCQCRPDNECAGGSTCSGGFCVLDDCEAGAKHCQCDGGECDSALTCHNGTVCIDSAGTEGGPCRPNGTCGRGLSCQAGVCAPCTMGADGCSCLAGGGCNGNLVCQNGTCAEKGARVPPSDPKCYTPCEEGLTRDDGTFLPCSSEGLMRGCVGEATCKEGSCVKDDQAPPTCSSELECPDFQTCIDGQCYSNCQYDSDCGGARSCYRHVCRTPCSATNDVCRQGYHCKTTDGENGYCMPLAEPVSGKARRKINGSFKTSTDLLEFSNIETATEFTLTNDSPTSREFVVRKIEHTEYTTQGSKTVDKKPLHWIKMGKKGAAKKVQEFKVLIDGNGGEATLELKSAANKTLKRWNGLIEVVHPDLGTQRIQLSYAGTPKGQWRGKMYYFAQFGDAKLDAWVNDKDNTAKLTNVGNALIQRWGALRRGRITLDEFKAVLTATNEGSWKWQSVRDVCPATKSGGACYLYNSPRGYGQYTDDLDAAPIPTGVVELPVALNLNPTSATHLEGRISSHKSLQYAGNPAVEIDLSDNPKNCSVQTPNACLVLMDSMQADIFVGGRYKTDSADQNCSEVPSSDFKLHREPWLVPGFTAGTELDQKTNRRYSYECRDTTLPFGVGNGMKDRNASLAASNPIPDGRTRKRRIKLIDGALINQNTFFILFEESFNSFLGANARDFTSYGYMMLTRSPADLEPEDFKGSKPKARSSQPKDVMEVSCSQDLVKTVLGPNESLTSKTADALISGVITGERPKTSQKFEITSRDAEEVHFYCEATGEIDGGPGNDGSPNPRINPCPAGSRVTYFTLNGDRITQRQIANLSCQQKGTCQDQLNKWRQSGAYNFRLDPVWRCKDPNKAYCDSNRKDPRKAKVFYKNHKRQPAFVPLLGEISKAFRYKTQFKSRSGKNIGFTPEICVPNSDQRPYCYSPKKIEEIRGRVDCAMHIFSEYFDKLDTKTQTMAQNYLVRNFSYSEERRPNRSLPIRHDGFERLNAELLVMLGDDAYTKAFASRFDLANSNQVSFEGSLFEPNGIDLSGGAGYEMYNLYQSTQYYQMVLDRFYRLSPLVNESIQLGSQNSRRNFITQETVIAYFKKLILASTQKSRAWSEVAKRYQSFNRPDLARRVIERAYTSTYLESVALSELMLKVVDVTVAEKQAQIVKSIEEAQRRYRAAMLDMRDVYSNITDEINFFGYAPDYIPFPALDRGDTNAFEKVLARARQKMQVAARKEQTALNKNRSYNVDKQSFQAELTRIKNNYENQLSDLCGTFAGDDGRIYPAIPKYAHLHERARLLGNPCGMMGNGAIHEAIVSAEVQRLDMKSIQQSFRRTKQEIEIERERVSKKCNKIAQMADYRWRTQGQINTLRAKIEQGQAMMNRLQRSYRQASNLANILTCSVGLSSDCAAAAVQSAILVGVGTAIETKTAQIEQSIAKQKNSIREIQRAKARWETLQRCELAKIDSNALVKRKLLSLEDIKLEALKADYNIRTALSRIEKLRNKAIRLIAEQKETEQLTINIEAARNDPNVRIYKNDSIITADRTFEVAMAEAYRATKLFEYYTSQSYAKKNRLFLIRMIGHGNYNLESYIQELENAFIEFEEQFGNPDTRVAVLSLRDDVLSIPRTDQNGASLPQAERVARLREKLTSPGLLDENGYLTLPFRTSIARLSPLTRNHKIDYIEAEIIGSDVGDTIGRIYLRQKGTGTVRSVDGDKNYYRLPKRTAVINPFFNGKRVFTPEVYRNGRLKDRPYANTHWELVINQKDERANQDVNLQSLTDIRLYLYYTDFTSL